MNESSFNSGETKVYRLNTAYRLYHYIVGAAALVGAVMVYHFVILSVVLALLAVFMISRALIISVSLDQIFVTYKDLFFENSLQRSSISAVERKHTGKGIILILWSNLDEKQNLAIPDLFAFDEAWDDWFNAYRDLSEDKPLTLF